MSNTLTKVSKKSIIIKTIQIEVINKQIKHNTMMRYTSLESWKRSNKRQDRESYLSYSKVVEVLEKLNK